MQKLKAFINPGSDKDDEVMYGDKNTGKLSGEGSHFGGKDKPSSSASENRQAQASDPIAVGAASAAPAAAEADISNATTDPTGAYAQAPLDSHPRGTAQTSGLTADRGALTSDATSSVYSRDATSTPAGQTLQSGDHNTGRDAALGTGAAATAAGIAAHHHNRNTANTAGTDSSVSHDPARNLSREEQEIQNATYTYRSYPLAGTSSQSQSLRHDSMPHMPGRFPSTDGSELQNQGNLTSSTIPEGRAVHDTPSEHHYGRDAALVGGAGAAGAAAHEHHKHRHDGSTPTTGLAHTSTSSQAAPSTASTIPHGSSSTTGPPIGATAPGSAQHVASTNPEHHYGRDAALVGGAGTAAYGLHKEHEHRGTAGNAAPLSGQQVSTDVSTNPSNRGGFFGAPQGTATSSSNQGTYLSYGEPHHGRDAAVIGGTAAAADAGEHAQGHHHHHHKKDDTALPASSTNRTQQPYTGASTSAQQPTGVPSAHQQPLGTSSASASTQAPVSQQNDHHYGRDAALVGGSAAAAGAGAHALDRGQDENTRLGHNRDITSTGKASSQPQTASEAPVGLGTSSSSPSAAHETSQSGPFHIRNPRNSDGTTSETAAPASQQKDHHYGRDAALVGGGAAAIGAGAHALDRHERDKAQPTGTGALSTGTATSQPQSATGTSSAYGTSASSGTASHPATASNQPSGTQRDDKDHHYGRDAALVGGGAAAAGAGERALHHHHDQDRAQGTHALSSAGEQSSEGPLPIRNSTQSETTSSTSGTAQPGSYASQSTSQQPSARTGEKDHHYGRDAALLGGGAVAAGAGERALHHHEQDRASATHAAPSTGQQMSGGPLPIRNPTGSETASGTSSAFPQMSSDVTSSGIQQPSSHATERDHHYGRDAALVGGGAAAAGAGERALHHRHGQGLQQSEGPLPVRNQAQSETTSGPPSSYPQTGSHAASGVAQQPSTYAGDRDHHYGRDAALLGGGAAAAGVGEHAFRHHEQGQQSSEGPLPLRNQPQAGTTSGTSSAYPQTGSQTVQAPSTHTGDKDHHYGRDAALVGGGAAATGAGAYALDHRSKDSTLARDTPAHAAQSSQVPSSSQVPPIGAAASPTTAQQTSPTGSHLEKDASHKGRDAAIVGGTAVAGGAAAHEFSKKEQEKLEKQQTKEAERQQKEAEKQQREAQKQQEKEAARAEKERKKNAEKEAAAAAAAAEAEKKKHEKDAKKEEKKHQKEVEKQEHEAQKKHEKEVAAAAAAAEAEKKKQEHARQKEEEKHQKQVEKEQKVDKKHHEQEVAAAAAAAEAERKHHEEENRKAEQERQKLQKQQQDVEPEEKGKKRRSIFGFLHRDKEDRSPSPARRATEEEKNGKLHKKEVGTAAGVGAAGLGAYELDKEHKKHEATRDANTAGVSPVDQGTTATHGATAPATAGTVGTATGPTGTGVAGRDATTGATTSPTTGIATGQTATEPTHEHEHSKAPYAAGAAGAAALGGAAYEHHKHGERDEQPLASRAQQPTSTTQQPIQGSQVPTEGASHSKAPYVAGAAGAAGLGGAAYEHHKHEERAAQPTGTQAEGPLSSTQKSGQAGQVPADRDSHNKAPLAAGAAGTAAAGGVAAHEHNKKNVSDAADDEKDEKSKKRRSFLGFLHRDKSKDRDSRKSSRSPRRSDVAAAAPATVAEEETRHHPTTTTGDHAAAADYANKDKTVTPPHDATGSNGQGNTGGVGRHHSKLHKEPPKKIREELEQKAEEIRRQSYEEHGGRHMGIDGEIGHHDQQA
ncbi:hypothetical protein K461DRAFT_297864 [Myriangium duriaei CBS 260.36]|uniref:Uncharacterized protein n=1 Tax=Myriangium duriaei CBS 260.36 TaxID=1168546 RepID=A0A9P4IVC9_9PEZI|nr:hypothetical protein K461DRAFT_297864 [Myriangium duriaei CBS 260.36]